MEESDYRNSTLEKWLRSKGMTTKKFAESVGCSRIILWKVKRGMAISPKHGEKIRELTEGQVSPKIERVGRPW